MSEYPVDRTSTDQSEDAEEFICHLPHEPDSERVSLLRQEPLVPEKAQRMAEFFSLLGDANRLRILSVLANQEMCVGDLAAMLNMKESAVSHQLRTLRSLRLVKYRKEGRHVFYCLKDRHVFELYQSVAEHLEERDEA